MLVAMATIMESHICCHSSQIRPKFKIVSLQIFIILKKYFVETKRYKLENTPFGGLMQYLMLGSSRDVYTGYVVI
jgi:hypothetical protein